MEKFWESEKGCLYNYDAISTYALLKSESIDMCITSPPYWALRDYNTDGQLGQEPLVKDYINDLCNIFDSVYPVIKKEGSLWVNIADTYYGGNKGMGGKTSKQLTNKGSMFVDGKKFNLKEFPRKSLCNIPARFSIEMQDRGWLLRNIIIWHKPNAWVTSAKDRFTVDYEYLYWFVKQPKYYFVQQFEPCIANSDWNPIRENISNSDYDSGTGQETHRPRNMRPHGDFRNQRSIWSINTQPIYGLKHFAKFPEKLLETPILATCPENGIVLDCFMGSGTTALKAEKMNRKWVGIELSEEYCETIVKRVNNV